MRVIDMTTATHPSRTGHAIWTSRLAFAAIGLMVGSWGSMVPYAKTRLQVDNAELGTILLCLGAGGLVAMPITSMLNLRVGPRRLIRSAVLGAGGLLVCLSVTLSPLLLGALLLGFGATVGMLDVAANALAVQTEARAGRALMSSFHGFYSLGGLIGAASMSALLKVGLPIAVAAGFVGGAMALAVWRCAGRLPDHTNSATGNAAPVFALPHGRLVLLGAMAFVVYMAEGAMLDWAAVFLHDHRGITVENAAWGYAAFALSMTVMRLTFGDILTERFGSVAIVRYGAGCTATGLLLAVITPWPCAALIGFAMVGMGSSSIVPVLLATASNDTRSHSVHAVASVTTLGYAGLLIGPTVIGFTARLLSLPMALGVVAISLACVATNAHRISAVSPAYSRSP